MHVCCMSSSSEENWWGKRAKLPDASASWVWVLALPPACCVTMNKAQLLSGLDFSLLDSLSLLDSVQDVRFYAASLMRLPGTRYVHYHIIIFIHIFFISLSFPVSVSFPLFFSPLSSSLLCFLLSSVSLSLCFFSFLSLSVSVSNSYSLFFSLLLFFL